MAEELRVSLSESQPNEDDSLDEDRQPLYDDRGTFLLTTDEIMRQFVKETDESFQTRDTQVSRIEESEEQHSFHEFDVTAEFVDS